MRGFKDLDRTIHEGARLAILSSLAGAEELTFTELKEALDLTDGNLGAHLKTLEAKKLVQTHREEGGGGRPATFVSLTNKGRTSLAEYLELLERIIAPARDAAEEGDHGLAMS